MRIAMFTNTYYPFVGGVPVSIERLSKGLLKQGHQVVVFAPTYEEDMAHEVTEQEDQLIIHRFKVRKQKLSNGCVVPKIFDLTVEKYFRQYAFDVIHVHHPMMVGYTAMYLSKKYEIPLVYTYHTRYEYYLQTFRLFQEEKEESKDGLKSKIKHKLLQITSNSIIPKHNRFFMNHCDAVIAPTKSMQDFLTEQHVVSPLHILPTGIHCPDYPTDQINKAPKESVEFITIARLEKEKNLSFLIQSMKGYQMKNGSSFHLTIVGNGSIREELQTQINELGLSSNITLVGNKSQEEIAELLKKSDLFLFSSKSETQGIVLLEAMSHGVPVVAVEASGVRDVVRNQYNGYQTEEEEDAFIHAIDKTLEEDGLYQELCKGAYETASRFDYSQIALLAEKIYIDSILSKNRRVAHAV